MSEKKAFVVLAVFAACGVLGTTSAARAQYNYDFEGGYVRPCSLEGTNPAYHPEIFGDPAVAKAYGFVQGPDHTWHVNCQSIEPAQKPKATGHRPRRPHP